MYLTTLPTELIERIFEFTTAGSFESLALTCKTAYYSLQKSTLAHHNEYRRQWRTLTYINDSPIQYDVQALLKLIEDPLIGSFTREAHLEFHHVHDEAFFTEAPRLGDGKTVPLLKAFLEKTTLLPPALREEFMTTFQKFCQDDPELEGDGSTIIRWDSSWNEFDIEEEAQRMGVLPTLMLLALMPNLEEFQPPTAWAKLTNDLRSSWPVVDAFVRAANEQAQNPQVSMPRKLKRIVPFHADEGMQQYTYLEAMVPFMGLKSVEVIHATNCLASEVAIPWRYPGSTSGLRVLQLDDSNVDTASMSKLFPNMPHLEVFRLSLAMKEGCYDWEPRSFFALMGEHVGSTLRELRVSTHDNDDEAPDDDACLKSMKEFTALVKAELSLKLFKGLLSEWEEGDGEDDDDDEDAEDDESDGEGRSNLPRLTDIFPSGLRELRLFTDLVQDEDELELITELFSLSSKQRALMSKCKITVVREFDNDDDGTRSVWDVVRRAGGRVEVGGGLEGLTRVDHYEGEDGDDE